MGRKTEIIKPVEDTSAAFLSKAEIILASDTASTELKAKAQTLKDLIVAHTPTVSAYNALQTEPNALVIEFNLRVDGINSARKALTVLATQLAVGGTLHINDAAALGINRV